MQSAHVVLYGKPGSKQNQLSCNQKKKNKKEHLKSWVQISKQFNVLWCRAILISSEVASYTSHDQ